jgi:hypothetical protein
LEAYDGAILHADALTDRNNGDLINMCATCKNSPTEEEPEAALVNNHPNQVLVADPRLAH